jgi:hypothetical protein
MGCRSWSLAARLLAATAPAWMMARECGGGGMGAALDAASLLDEQALQQLVAQPTCAPPCPEGSYATPRLPVAAHRPAANGCGPQSNAHGELGEAGRYQIKEPHGLIGCCNAHDLCFSTCGMAFEECEDRFERCMAGVCGALPPTPAAAVADCQAQAVRFSSLTREFGCSFHRSSVHGDGHWEPACECNPAEQVAARVGEWLAEFHREYGAVDEPAPTPTVDPRDNRLLLWNLTVRHAARYAQFVEGLVEAEMVLLDHDHSAAAVAPAARPQQKNDDDDDVPTPGGALRPKPQKKVPSKLQQRGGYPEKPARRQSFPSHWGPPPGRQTKDLRNLPGGYGTGSSTLARWIKQKLNEDEKGQRGEA